MIISTVTIKENFEVIDTIFHVQGAKQKGFMGTGAIDMDEAFNDAKAALATMARDRGGNAVIGCDFEIRIASDALNTQVLEIFCFGTVVKTHE